LRPATWTDRRASAHGDLSSRYIDEAMSSRCFAVMAVALPCCKPHELPRKPDYEYEDFGCWSPKRTVKVWLPTKPERVTYRCPVCGYMRTFSAAELTTLRAAGRIPRCSRAGHRRGVAMKPME